MRPTHLHFRIARAVAGVVIAGALGGCAFVLPQAEALRTEWPAGVPTQVELDAVPFFPQEDYQCGPAALATVLGSDGLAVTPEDLVPKVYLPNRRGSLQIEMMAAPRTYGMVSWQIAPRLDDLLREVQAGNPVIVLQDYGVWPLSYWHYAVVVGYDRESGKVVLRSGQKRRLQMPFHVLEYTWKESRYWAMVAVLPDRIPVTATEAAWSEAVHAMERVAPRESARRAYRALLARWPDSLSGAIGLSNLDYGDGRLREAEEVLRAALQRHPKSAVVLNNLAQVLSDLNRPREALPLVDAAIAQGGAFEAEARETRAQIVRKLPAAMP